MIEARAQFTAAETVERKCAKRTGSKPDGKGPQGPCGAEAVMWIEVRNSITGDLISSGYYCEQHNYGQLKGLMYGAYARPIIVSFKRWAPGVMG